MEPEPEVTTENELLTNVADWFEVANLGEIVNRRVIKYIAERFAGVRMVLDETDRLSAPAFGTLNEAPDRD